MLVWYPESLICKIWFAVGTADFIHIHNKTDKKPVPNYFTKALGF